MQEKTKAQAETAVQSILACLPGEQVRLANSLATLTDNWIIVRPAGRGGQILLSIHSVRQVQRIRTTYPGLLVIASGLGLIAAAAWFSKEGSGAALPIAVIGIFFAAAYFGTRRASVLFSTPSESGETVLGTLREAAEIERAVRFWSDLG